MKDFFRSTSIKKTYTILFFILVIGIYQIIEISETTGGENMNPLKILAREYSGWEMTEEDRIYQRENIFEYMDGAGEIYLAFDFKYLFVREYKRGEEFPIVVEIYLMSSSPDAYGIFAQDTDGEQVKVGEEAIYALGLLRFWKGNIFCRILAAQNTREAKSVVMKMGHIIAESIQRESKRPDILRYLPLTGLKTKSIRYFHKLVSLNSHYYLSDTNLLQLGEKVEAVLASYQNDDQKALLLLIQYPEAGLAKTAYLDFVHLYYKKEPELHQDILLQKLEDGKCLSAKNADDFNIFIFEASDQDICLWLTSTIETRLEDESNE
jgi:hypothetical protein